jgi:hypothetical protein
MANDIHFRDTHVAHGLRSPVATLEQRKRRSIEDSRYPREAGANRGDYPMNAGDGHDLANSVGERKLLTDHTGERETAQIKDEHIFKSRQLLAGTAAGNATNEDEEKVAPDGSEDGLQCHE